ncbi:hypothetical protein BGW39_000521 [Mortierella sp. 14UC]|nr:hypothetical protein BGW39_000521 [Mortierella sp. 14UC]
MARLNSIFPQPSKAHSVHLTNFHLADGPIAKGGGGGRGGGGGGRGGGGGGSSPRPPTVPPIIIIPGTGSGGHVHSGGGASNSTAPYDSSTSTKTASLIGGILGGLAALAFLVLFGVCFFKSRRKAQQKIKDAEAQEQQEQQNAALMGGDGPDGVVVPYSPMPMPYPPMPVPSPLAAPAPQPEWPETKSPLYKQTPSTDSLLISASTVIAPPVLAESEKTQGRTLPVSNQSSQSTLDGVARLSSSSSSSPRLVPITPTEGPPSYTPPGGLNGHTAKPSSPR